MSLRATDFLKEHSAVLYTLGPSSGKVLRKESWKFPSQLHGRHEWHLQGQSPDLCAFNTGLFWIAQKRGHSAEMTHVQLRQRPQAKPCLGACGIY